MRRLSERTLWYLTGLTLAALLIIAFAGASVVYRYSSSMQWVLHTDQVETQIERIRSSLYAAENGRFQYVFAGQAEGLRQYRTAADNLSQQVAKLRTLTEDNSAQQSLIAAIKPLVEQQLNILRTSTEMKLQGGSPELQDQYSNTVFYLSRATASQLEAMRTEEEKLLAQRRIVSDKTYRTQKMVLSISFAIMLLVSALNFIELMFQLRERQNAERAVRRLSGRILQVQDEERRKLSRDLHDGIGQLFAALKMSLDQLLLASVGSRQVSQVLSECIAMVDEGMSQARTLSYLLHPPMLDEIGFRAAAQWLVDGFSERSNIPVTVEIIGNLSLTREMELTLFRVLQEGLTNIHRHSGSTRAEVVIAALPHCVTMTLKDNGKGIPELVLGSFKSSNAPTGVGLAGMRGRVADFNGSLVLESSPGQGTTVRVSIPIADSLEGANCSSEPPTPHNVQSMTDRKQSASSPSGVSLAKEANL